MARAVLGLLVIGMFALTGYYAMATIGHEEHAPTVDWTAIKSCCSHGKCCQHKESTGCCSESGECTGACGAHDKAAEPCCEGKKKE